MTPGFPQEKPAAMSAFFRLSMRLGAIRGLAACAAFLLCAAMAHAGPAPAGVHAKTPRPAAKAPAPPPLEIGEINTYKALPFFSEAYRRGWMLALDEINAEGGVLGRKLDVRSRDDHGNPDDAVRAAQALVDKDGVVALFGGYSSEVALALSRYALDNRILYLAVAPLTQRLTWQEGNRYTFRLRPAAWMHAAAVAPKALGLRKLRWALVYRDTESGRAAIDAFKGLMRTFQSKTEFIVEQAAPAARFDAVAAAKVIAEARPDAIFNTLTGAQLAAFARAGAAAHLFDGVPVVSLFTGDPENLAVLDAPIPDGWIITGYPRDAIDTPENKAFVQAYTARYQDAPATAAVLGYAAMHSIAEGLKRAGSPDREALAAAFPRLQVPTPFGAIEYRNLDHQSTLGTYLGYTGHADGKLVMERFVYTSGTRLQPLDEQIRRLRVQAARAAAAMDAQGKDAASASQTSPRLPTQGDTAGGSSCSPKGAADAETSAQAATQGQAAQARATQAQATQAQATQAQATQAQATEGQGTQAQATQGLGTQGPSAQPRTRPNTRPDTELTTRLRSARPGGAAATVGSAPAASSAAGPGTAPAAAASPAASPGSAPGATASPAPATAAGPARLSPPSVPVRKPLAWPAIQANTPPGRVLTPALPDWPDQVGR
jgi:ABC-type branched-subunit amino acid transport system substrate-binding protein